VPVEARDAVLVHAIQPKDKLWELRHMDPVSCPAPPKKGAVLPVGVDALGNYCRRYPVVLAGS
jgi:hypothetical protein